jgi:hypothetical protein
MTWLVMSVKFGLMRIQANEIAWMYSGLLNKQCLITI